MGNKPKELADQLDERERVFVDEYLVSWNARAAAVEAGYKAADGQRLLQRSLIRAVLAKRVDDRAMSANEALERLAQHARASIADVLTEDGQVDVSALVRSEAAHLVKSIEWTKYGPKIVLHDAQAALFKIADALGLFNHIEAGVQITPEQLANMSDDELDRLEKRLRGGTRANRR